MSKVKAPRKKLTPYQIFGWTPLAIFLASAGTVALLSILRDLKG